MATAMQTGQHLRHQQQQSLVTIALADVKFRHLPAETSGVQPMMWDKQLTRKPMLLLRLSGLLLLRYELRQLLSLLIQEPPRSARACHRATNA